MTNDRRGKHQIQMGTGKAKCQYCNDPITTEEWEVVLKSNHYVYTKHWHLFSSGQCEGWIHHEWPFITTLLYRLTDIAGNDYNEFMDSLITLWEEGPG